MTGAKSDTTRPPKLKGFLANGFEINEQNFVAAFSILIIQLKLTVERPKKKHILPQLSKSHAYSFKVSEAVSVMDNLSLKIDLGIIDNVLSFSFGTDLALSLLKKFFAGHLLHDPCSRTEATLHSHSLVQITPKGVAVLHNFCKSVGMKRQDMPEVVRSDFNTMKLFEFDRSSSTRRALYSKYLNHILISEMLGPLPNVWSPEAIPRPTPNLYEKEELEYHLGSDHVMFSGSVAKPAATANQNTLSPFHHRYFSNPESDSHVQYYESVSGMRLFRDKVFASKGKDLYVEYSFSGKAFVQWLCDCTTLYSASEAVEFGQLMLHYGLIFPVTQFGDAGTFTNHRDAYYTWNELEENLCRWSSATRTSKDLRKSASVENEDSEPAKNHKKDVFKKLLADPGIRHLFRSHLEKEKCSENINAFLQLKEFQSVKRKLSSLMKHHNKSDDPLKKERLLVAAEKLSSKCLGMASYLCSRYFSPDSTCNLNIDFGLQQEINRVIALMKGNSFPETPLSDGDFAAYLKTPIMHEEMTFELKCETTKDQSGEQTSLTSSEMGELSKDHSSMTEVIEMLDKIDRVFGKIAYSVYRMMEVDSYPKFIQSEEYMLAVETLTQRS